MASKLVYEFDHDEEFSHTVHVSSSLFHSNASSFNQEANIEEPSFFASIEGDFSSCDTNDEKEVIYGVSIDIDDDPITHSLFSKSRILDSEIYVPNPSHFVHTSLIDGAQPSDFQDVCLAKSSLICVIPLTLLDLMCFNISSFVLGINTQNLLEDCEHPLISSFHTEDSLPVYSHESIDMLICDPLDSDLESCFQADTQFIPPLIPSTIPLNTPKTIQIPSSLH